jgi:hypothetical protein
MFPELSTKLDIAVETGVTSYFVGTALVFAYLGATYEISYAILGNILSFMAGLCFYHLKTQVDD